MSLTILLQHLREANITKEQFRALVTAYCITNDINVDTLSWDVLIRDLHDNYCCFSELGSYEDFDNYMCELLV